MKPFNEKANLLMRESNRLIGRRDFLAKELAKFQNESAQYNEETKNYDNLRRDLLADIKAFPKGTWVIKSSNNTYHLFVRTNRYAVTLSRKGVESKVSFGEFIKDFRIANNVEVAQHEAFLRSQLTVKITSPSNSIPTSSVVNDFNQFNCEFYMVTCTGTHGAKVRHSTYREAHLEAKRIAKKMNHPAWVVGVVGKINP